MTTLCLVRGRVQQVRVDEAVLLLKGRVVLRVTSPRVLGVVVVVGPFRLELPLDLGW